MGDDLFGIGAAGHQPHHRIADFPLLHSLAHGTDNTGIFEPGDAAAGARWRRVAAHHLQQVCPVNPTGFDFNADFFRPGLRVGQGVQLQLLIFNTPGAHGCAPIRRI